MSNLRLVTLDCEQTPPTVEVRQQPYPLDADSPESFITTLFIGEYPNQIQLTWDTPTAEDGIAIVDEMCGALVRSNAAAAGKLGKDDD